MKNITALIVCASILSAPLVANHEELERLKKESAQMQQLVAQLKARVDAQDTQLNELKKNAEGNSTWRTGFAIGTYVGLFAGASLVSLGVHITMILTKK